MRKTMIIIAALILMPIFAAAQRGIPRSNTVSVSSTVITKTSKAPNTYEARVGFQQMAGVSFGPSFDGTPVVGVSYVGGYRFNDYLFVGGGINPQILDIVDYMVLPIYGQCRAYFTKRIWRPYLALSLGGTYESFPDDTQFYGDFSFGVDAHVSEKLNAYMALGINNIGVLFKTGLSF